MYLQWYCSAYCSVESDGVEIIPIIIYNIGGSSTMVRYKLELNACRSKLSDKQLVPLERPVSVVITTISTNPPPAKLLSSYFKKPAKTSKDPKAAESAGDGAFIGTDEEEKAYLEQVPVDMIACGSGPLGRGRGYSKSSGRGRGKKRKWKTKPVLKVFVYTCMLYLKIF